MPVVDFTEEELRNLRIFLSRTQLTGQEVPAFIPVMSKINTPQSDEPPDEPKEES